MITMDPTDAPEHSTNTSLDSDDDQITSRLLVESQTIEDNEKHSPNTSHQTDTTIKPDIDENDTSNKPHNIQSTITIAALVAGAATFLAATLYRHFKRSQTSSNKSKDLSALYVQPINLTTPSVPSVPDSPTTTTRPTSTAVLPLKNYTFTISDRIDVTRVQTRFGCTEWQTLHKPCTISAPIVDALISNGAIATAVTQSQPFGISYRDIDSLLFDSTAQKIFSGPFYRKTRSNNSSLLSLDNPLSSEYIHGGGEYGSIHSVSSSNNNNHNKQHQRNTANSYATFSVCVDELGTALIPAACCGVYAYRPTAGLLPVDSIKVASSTLSTPCIASSDPLSLLKVATSLGVGGSSSSSDGSISQYLVAQDLFAFCDDEVKNAAPAVVSAVRRWAGADQAQALMLCHWLYYRIPSLMPFIHQAQKRSHTSNSGGNGGDSSTNGQTASTNNNTTNTTTNNNSNTTTTNNNDTPDPDIILDALYIVSTTIKLSELYKSTAGAWAINNIDTLPTETARVVQESKHYATNQMTTQYTLAIRVAEELSQAMRAALQDGYVFVIPTLPGLPPKSDGSVSSEAMGRFHKRCVQFAALSSLAGVPQVTMPMPVQSSGGLCLGISLVTLQRKDATLLHAATKMGPMLFKAIDEYQEKKAHARSLITQQSEEEDAVARVMAAAVRAKEDGNTAFKAGKYHDAVRDYTKAIQLDPKNPTYSSNRAMAYLKLGMYSKAEHDCDVALELDPTMVKALLRRGSARLAQGAVDDARDDFRAVLKLEPRNKQALEELSRLGGTNSDGDSLLYN